MTQTHKGQVREDTRRRLYRLARPANTPHTGTSDKSLPGPAHPNYNPSLTQRDANLTAVNPDAAMIETSAQTGLGIDELCRWLSGLRPKIDTTTDT
jgi:hypothetical protein